MQAPEPTPQHQWLKKLLGEWTTEMDCPSPDKPNDKSHGTESVKSLGDLWIVADGKGQMPDGAPATMMMTLGYDPQKQRFVGTWVGSMMTYMWVYDGELDTGRNILTLNAEGPDFSQQGKMAKYKDVIEFKSDDHRILTSHTLKSDGQWHQFMTAHYRRKR